MNTCEVTYPDGRTRQVRNLGWLLRHAGEVKSILCDPLPDGGMLVAVLNDGTIYRCGFRSWRVLCEWIKRPSLSHAKKTVTGGIWGN